MSEFQIRKGETILSAVLAQASRPEKILAVVNEGNLYRLDAVADRDFRALGVTIRDADGYRIYYHTVLAVFMGALAEVYPGLCASAEHFIGDALYIAPAQNEAFTSEQLRLIEEKMRDFVQRDIPLCRKRTPYREAVDILLKEGRHDTVLLFKHIRPETIDLIEVESNHFIFRNYLAPSAGYARNFSIKPYYPGLLLLFETPESNGNIPRFQEQRNLAKTYQRSKDELQLLHLETVGEINEQIIQGRTRHMTHMIDHQLENRLFYLARSIQRDDDIRLILVAGPSSSGKTTFSRKLAAHLGSLGKFPVTLSMDDYFVDRSKTPLDKDGVPNFESPDAIDIERFNKDMLQLLEGTEVQMPRFDFLTGETRTDGKTIRIDRHHPMIIEGIHGLNPRMTEAIPEKNKIKVYISALTQLNIDYRNRIAATDVRFLRRLVRDQLFRGHDAARTFELWKNVRQSENTEIFAFQEQADVSIDTSLAYEIFVLKPFAEKLLATIDRSSPYWKDAKRLLRLLSYFLPIDARDVSDSSLLREFIGGSHYEEECEWT